jgi:hypothetical protein
VIAGLAFTLPKTTASHACSFPLTNLYGIPHGEACALTLDWFTRVNAAAENGRVNRLAARLGFRDAEAMADAIDELKRRTGMRRDLKDLALTDAQVAALVKASRHPNLYNNPGEITDGMLFTLYGSMRCPAASGRRHTKRRRGRHGHFRRDHRPGFRQRRQAHRQPAGPRAGRQLLRKQDFDAGFAVQRIRRALFRGE